LEVGTTELGGVRGEASFFNAGADRRLAFRVDVEMRLEDLETNKDRRVGVMFKAPCAGDYWRSQKTSSTAGALRRQRTCDLVTTGAVDKLRDNQTAELKMGLAISTTSFTCDIQASPIWFSPGPIGAIPWTANFAASSASPWRS
jgi:hypothetical protein